MIDIEVPCCESTVRVERLDRPIRCDPCGIDLELAPDEPVAEPIAA